MSTARSRENVRTRCRQGHAEARYNLGIMAIENEAGQPDFARAIDLFKRAAGAGNADGGLFARRARASGACDIERNDAEAIKWFRQAADADNVPGMVEVRHHAVQRRRRGEGRSGGARMFLKAAQRNNPGRAEPRRAPACGGRGITTDMVEAMKWHLLARTARGRSGRMGSTAG